MVFSNVVNVKSFNKFQVSVDENRKYDTDVKISLSDEQKQAYDNIIGKILNYSVILLDGETGSGKTEVYCEVIRELISRDNKAQVLVLLPEIVLTLQLIKRIRYYFESYFPVEWHSNLTLKSVESVGYQ